MVQGSRHNGQRRCDLVNQHLAVFGRVHFTGGEYLFGGCAIPRSALVLGRLIGIDRLTRAAPDAIGALHGVKATPLCCLTQRSQGRRFVDKRGQRHQSSRAGDVRHDETIEAVDHRASDQFPE